MKSVLRAVIAIFKNLTQSIVFISNHSINDSAYPVLNVLLKGVLVHSATCNPLNS